MFATRSWVGAVLPPHTTASRQLSAYTQLFSTVEGNSTFYALPSLTTVAKWKAEIPDHFRFAFKLPRTITHEKALQFYEADLSRFLEVLSPLGSCLGPCMLQLPPSAGRSAGRRVRHFLEHWPQDRPLAVELRHVDWFDQGNNERDLHRLLTHFGVERVCFDSRPLFSLPPKDPSTAEAQSRKPRVPVRKIALGQHPLVRFIGRNQVEECDPFLREWAETVAIWIREGRSPFFYCHTPDDHHAPWLARRFHEHLCQVMPEMAPLPDWPLRPTSSDRAQLSLL
ncbi:MAG: DUF72 domain-containing protein [Myxococcales bacterium]|nr:DUF72 domain-containing protein [Myxococcales bacterium]